MPDTTAHHIHASYFVTDTESVMSKDKNQLIEFVYSELTKRVASEIVWKKIGLKKRESPDDGDGDLYELDFYVFTGEELQQFVHEMRLQRRK
jgi:hypothetical protein